MPYTRSKASVISLTRFLLRSIFFINGPSMVAVGIFIHLYTTSLFWEIKKFNDFPFIDHL